MCFISHNICDVVFCNIYIYIHIYITYYSLDNPQQEKKHLTCCTLLKRSHSRSLPCLLHVLQYILQIGFLHKQDILHRCELLDVTSDCQFEDSPTNHKSTRLHVFMQADLRSPQNSTVNPHTSHRMAFHQGRHHHPQSLGKSFGYYVTTHRRLKIKGNMDLRESACEIRQDL